MPSKQKLRVLDTHVHFFLQNLDDTQKAGHTQASYRSDLSRFRKFLEHHCSPILKQLDHLDLATLKEFGETLKAEGLRPNTRRRILLTLRRFFQYLVQKGQIQADFINLLPTPTKDERIPKVVSWNELVAAILRLPEDSLLPLRNRCILLALAETGAQVSEIALLRFENLEGSLLAIGGKQSRALEISEDLRFALRKLQQAMQQLRQNADVEQAWCFQGFNRFGPLAGPISPRGIEILVKELGPALGFEDLVPRGFRHSIVANWIECGLSQKEICARLGLRTTYSMKLYQPYFDTYQAKILTPASAQKNQNGEHTHE